MSAFHHERVLSVRHWTDRLFSFRTTRTPAFRFRSGQFVMMGLEADGQAAAARLFAGERPLRRRARVLLDQGPRRAADLAPAAPQGGRRGAGRPQADRHPGSRQPAARPNLFLLGTGTGLAPFLSIIKDPETYDKFDRIVVAHGVRWIKDLAYGDFIADELPNDELIGDLVREKLDLLSDRDARAVPQPGPHVAGADDRHADGDARPAADRPGVFYIILTCLCRTQVTTPQISKSSREVTSMTG